MIRVFQSKTALWKKPDSPAPHTGLIVAASVRPYLLARAMRYQVQAILITRYYQLEDANGPRQ